MENGWYPTSIAYRTHPNCQISLFREYSHFKRDSGAKNPSVPTRISVTTVSNEEDEAHARLEAVDRSSMKPKSMSFVCGECPVGDEKVIKLQSLISLRRGRGIKDEERTKKEEERGPMEKSFLVNGGDRDHD